jgi:2'-5' RNA ligase
MLESMQAIYDSMWDSGLRALKQGGYRLDPLIDSPLDARRGISLVMRPAAEVAERVRDFLSECRAIEPDQYFYPEGDLHVTFLSLLCCRPGFALGPGEGDAYLGLLLNALRDADPIRIGHSGLTLSDSCLVMRGYCGPELGLLRDRVRAALDDSGLPHDSDARYRLVTAHSTILRYRAPLRDPMAFAAFLEENRERDFGASSIDEVEFVENDWYMRSRSLAALGLLRLGAG